MLKKNVMAGSYRGRIGCKQTEKGYAQSLTRGWSPGAPKKVDPFPGSPTSAGPEDSWLARNQITFAHDNHPG